MATTTEAKIRKGYLELAKRPGAWVDLEKIAQAAFGDAVPTDWERTLQGMDRQAGVNVAPEEDQKTISRRDRQFEIRIGGQRQHMIRIG